MTGVELKQHIKGSNMKAMVLILTTLVFVVPQVFAGEAGKLKAAAEDTDAIVTKLRASPSDGNLLGALAKAAMAAKKEEKKAQALAICYAGYMLMNRTDMAEKAKAVLDRDCALSSYRQMLETNEFMVVADCEKCGGAGKTEEVCPDCRGVVPKWTRDVAPNMQNATLCSACNGAGSKPGIGGKRILCAKCRGQGICTKCNGTGKVQVVCKACKDGKTRTFDAQKAREFYMRLLEE